MPVADPLSCATRPRADSSDPELQYQSPCHKRHGSRQEEDFEATSALWWSPRQDRFFSSSLEVLGPSGQMSSAKPGEVPPGPPVDAWPRANAPHPMAILESMGVFPGTLMQRSLSGCQREDQLPFPACFWIRMQGPSKVPTGLPQPQWRSPLLPPSPSSPDEAVAGLSQIVPQDNARAHQELLKKVAASLGLEAEELAEPTDGLFDILAVVALSRVALPLYDGVVKLVKAWWQILSSLPPISKRVDRK